MVVSFFEVMSVIVAAASSQDLRALKGLRFEQLRGDRAGQCSLRLNDQYRLIIEVEEESSGEVIVVIEIVDYH